MSILRYDFGLSGRESTSMQENIHPKYTTNKVTCSCGSVFSIASTMCRDLNLEICSNCHPFYTGQQKMVDTAGMVQKFRDKYKKRGKKK